jgi:transcriptional regulator with XRE-family HTH domain
MRSRGIDDIRSTAGGRRLIERERLWIEATEVLCRLMESKRVSSAELARRLEVSPARISQLLSGTRNLTLTTLADAFHALGRAMHVTHGPPTEKTGAMTRTKTADRLRRRSR